MSELEPERGNKKLEARILELERVVKALLKGIQEIESEVGDSMPAGEYYGVKFE